MAQTNNFMGLICCSRLLEMVPALVDSIKSHGLALVLDRSQGTDGNLAAFDEAFSRRFDGILESHGVLRFNDSIDI